MTDDVVAELDRWLDNSNDSTTAIARRVVLRARDEIVALRGYRVECERQFQAKVAEIGGLLDRAHQARDEALEEAARACERRGDETGPQEAYAVLDVESYTSACGGCAYDIRALKEKRDE